MAISCGYISQAIWIHFLRFFFLKAIEKEIYPIYSCGCLDKSLEDNRSVPNNVCISSNTKMVITSTAAIFVHDTNLCVKVNVLYREHNEHLTLLMQDSGIEM